MSRRVMQSLFLATLLGGWLLAGPASAQSIVFNGGVPNDSNGNEMSQWIQAEDFAFGSPTSFNSVRFWTLEMPVGAFLGTMTWQVRADAGGSPGAIISTGTVAPTLRVLEAPGIAFGLDRYRYEIPTGTIGLGAGTFWLALHNGTLANQTRMEFYWDATGAGFGANGQELIAPFTGAWAGNGVQHAFQLLSAAVPEPTTMALCGVALAVAGIGYLRHRRKKII